MKKWKKKKSGSHLDLNRRPSTYKAKTLTTTPRRQNNVSCWNPCFMNRLGILKYLNFSAVCQQNQKLRAPFKAAQKKNLMMRCTLLGIFFSLIEFLKENFLRSEIILKVNFPSCLSAKFKNFLRSFTSLGKPTFDI